jgi:hypothetical protein
MMKISVHSVVFSAASFLLLVSGAYAGPPPSEKLEPVVTKIIQCSAKSSIWLQGASFQVSNLAVQASSDPDTFGFVGELMTTYAGGQKQEKSLIKGTASAKSDLKVTSMQLTDDADETREVHASCLN